MIPVVTMMAARVVTVRAIVTGSHDDDGSRAVSIVVRARVSMIVRPADHNLTAEVRIPETQRNTNPGLGLRDADPKTKQQRDNDEHAFHTYLLETGRNGRRMPPIQMLIL